MNLEPRRGPLDQLANVNIKLSLVGVAQKFGALLALTGPLVGGLSGWSLVEAAGWDGRLLVGGFVAAVLGSGLNQGATWLSSSRRESVDRKISNRVTAGLRTLRGRMGRARDASDFHSQLLRSIAATAQELVPSPDVDVLCCLFLPDGQHLELVAYSDFRQQREPSARISTDGSYGAAHAFTTGKTVYHSTFDAPELKKVFSGKDYSCLLCLPLDHMGTPLGVVTLDATRPHHWDGRVDYLVAHALPLTEILATSLALQLQSGQGGSR